LVFGWAPLFYFSLGSGQRFVARQPRLECFPIAWNHVIEKETLKFRDLEHVRIEEAEQLFRDML
jgi:hypothetical protein